MGNSMICLIDLSVLSGGGRINTITINENKTYLFSLRFTVLQPYFHRMHEGNT
jgi:hypothetical protein